MKILYKIPLDTKNLSNFLEDEKNFLIGFLGKLEEVNTERLAKKSADLLIKLKEELPSEIEMIFPLKNPKNQIQSLLSIAQSFTTAFKKAKLKDLGITSKWVLLSNGYLGSFVEEDYEITILLYLIAAIYQSRALANVQTSPQYRYYYISALSALLGAIEFMDRLSPDSEHYAYAFYQMLLMRKLELEAEITKSEAFIARKMGDFDRAAKLFAGAASYRFSMMSYNLPSDSDNKVKIYASTELGMACFYIAVGLTNVNDSKKAYPYLLKARSYFENAAKLSEDNTDLLESANKRLELVNPYIDRIKDTIEQSEIKIEDIPDPQPLMVHPEPKPILSPNDTTLEQTLICSSCIKKIPWTDVCPECKENIIPIE